MTAAAIGILLLVALALAVALVSVVARDRGGAVAERSEQPDEEVVSGLLAELRKWQAEAAHWKATAERLQRELDGRRGPAG